ncbi:hypothetical protein ACEQ8H_001017 [Pleosporales sp. CAS-2024a]
MSCHETKTEHPCPNHVVHQHKFPELAISRNRDGSNQQKYFRAMIFFNKKPGLTDDFFHEHWKSVHADLTMQVDNAGVNLVRYVQVSHRSIWAGCTHVRFDVKHATLKFPTRTQFHQEQQHIDALCPLLKASGGTMKMVEWDGAAEFHAETPEKFTAYMLSVYASPKLVGCGSRFVDMVKGYQIMGGYDNLIMGAAVPRQGKDGIMNTDKRLNVKRKFEEDEEEGTKQDDEDIVCKKLRVAEP